MRLKQGGTAASGRSEKSAPLHSEMLPRKYIQKWNSGCHHVFCVLSIIFVIYLIVNAISMFNISNPILSLDVDGLAAQIIIDANDGARGVIGWQNTK